jgi:hypothetical protein
MLPMADRVDALSSKTIFQMFANPYTSKSSNLSISANQQRCNHFTGRISASSADRKCHARGLLSGTRIMILVKRRAQPTTQVRLVIICWKTRQGSFQRPEKEKTTILFQRFQRSVTVSPCSGSCPDSGSCSHGLKTKAQTSSKDDLITGNTLTCYMKELIDTECQYDVTGTWKHHAIIAIQHVNTTGTILTQ